MRYRWPPITRLQLLVVVALCLVGGARADAAPGDAAFDGTAVHAPVAIEHDHQTDPWEGFNRKIFAFNEVLDRYLMLPVAKAYRYVTPAPVDQGITNVLTNLLMPVTIANDVFQLKLKTAGSDVGRFVINSTVGIVGVFDVATRMGLSNEREDFGQTLGYWGVGSGPFVVLPVFGARTVRDALGLIPDWGLSLHNYYIDDVATRNVLLGLQLIDTRADLIPAEQLISGDRYIFLRDAYLQQREYLIRDGNVEDDFGEDEFDDFDDFDGDDLPDFGD